MGKVLLSELTETQIDSLYPDERLITVTEKTIGTKTELKLELANIRHTGISVDREGGVIGVEGVARAIRDSSGKVVAALTISIPVYRTNEAKRQKIVELIKMGAALISNQLGFTETTNPIRDIQEIYQWWEQTKCGEVFRSTD
jgi:DNA-binding IclR family transcriptional regulator